MAAFSRIGCSNLNFRLYLNFGVVDLVASGYGHGRCAFCTVLFHGSCPCVAKSWKHSLFLLLGAHVQSSMPTYAKEAFFGRFVGLLAENQRATFAGSMASAWLSLRLQVRARAVHAFRRRPTLRSGCTYTVRFNIEYRRASFPRSAVHVPCYFACLPIITVVIVAGGWCATL